MSIANDILKRVRAFRETGALPGGLTASTEEEVAKAGARYARAAGASKVAQFSRLAVQAAKDQLANERLARLQTGETATRANALQDFLEKHGAAELPSMDFFLRVPAEVGMGAGRYLRENTDPEQVDLYPGYELARAYDRAVPRGTEPRALAAVPGRTTAGAEDNGRWVAACVESGDTKALVTFKQTGRMAALKASGVWQALGDGAGGYGDALGNPFAPFAFNSGMDLVELSRTDCEELGLLGDGEAATVPDVDYADLFKFSGPTGPTEQWTPFAARREAVAA